MTFYEKFDNWWRSYYQDMYIAEINHEKHDYIKLKELARDDEEYHEWLDVFNDEFKRVGIDYLFPCIEKVLDKTFIPKDDFIDLFKRNGWITKYSKGD